nr:Asp-tRNA(Asn)/Glu-tRNA(Gln) amidotransferase GatCAB subunit B [Chitinophagales bacterium]
YFPEPDLPPLRIHAAMVEEIRSGMPALPKELQKRYEQELGLSTYDAALLTAEKSVVTYFEALIQHTTRYKAAANWILGPVREWLNAGARDMDDFPVAPAQLAALLALIDEGKLSFSAAAQQLLPVWVEEPDTAPDALAQKLNLIQETDEAFIEQLVDEALKAFPDKVAEYRNGKKGLIGLFMGEVMKRSKGKADPKVATALLQKKLEA